MEGAKVRQRSESFADHFSQATMFWNSMSDWEKSISRRPSPSNSTRSRTRTFART
ncbi:MAG: catalase-related domain-containing protein [Acetobacteraceae bacterium]